MDMGLYIDDLNKKIGGTEEKSKIWEYFQKKGLSELGDNGNIANQLHNNWKFAKEKEKENQKLRSENKELKEELEWEKNIYKELLGQYWEHHVWDCKNPEHDHCTGDQ